MDLYQAARKAGVALFAQPVSYRRSSFLKMGSWMVYNLKGWTSHSTDLQGLNGLALEISGKNKRTEGLFIRMTKAERLALAKHLLDSVDL